MKAEIDFSLLSNNEQFHLLLTFFLEKQMPNCFTIKIEKYLCLCDNSVIILYAWSPNLPLKSLLNPEKRFKISHTVMCRSSLTTKDCQHYHITLWMRVSHKQVSH